MICNLGVVGPNPTGSFLGEFPEWSKGTDCKSALLSASVAALRDKGQANGALAGVMGDRIRNQSDPALPGNLLHNLGFPNARRSKE